MVQQIPMKAGSCCIFTEALTHGTLPWRSAAERRCLIYRYNPTWLINSAGAGPGTGERLVAQQAALEQIEPHLSPLQRALMEPAWMANGRDVGEEGGRPDIGALCAALPGGLPPNDDTNGVAFYTIGRL